MLRAIAVGAAAGTAVAILQGALPVIADWISHWSGILMGVVIGVIHANPPECSNSVDLTGIWRYAI